MRNAQSLVDDRSDRNILITSQQRRLDDVERAPSVNREEYKKNHAEYDNRGLPPRSLKGSHANNTRSMKHLDSRGQSNPGAPYSNKLASILQKPVRAS